MKILITGCAGFIGYHTTKKLLNKNHYIVGLDSLNKYYDINLKKYRLSKLKKINKFKFIKNDLKNFNKIYYLLNKHKIDVVLHLAAQPGVRYSLKNPKSYIDNNLLCFFNILEASKNYKIKHFVYASSSSVYGSSKKKKFQENQSTDSPIQLYAATKKSNEIITESYSNLFKIKSTGLRFFSVYGPAGRPDMAIYKFTQKIVNKKKIELYNFGNHARDFTYVDDAVNAIYKIISKKKSRKTLHEVYNIASGKTVKLIDLVKIIEKKLNIKSKCKFLSLQKGDVIKTSASISKIKKDYKYNPKVNIENGIQKFIRWYLEYKKFKKKYE